MASEPASWEACTQAALAGNPPCAAYGAVLASFCRLYGGGRGSPAVKELDSFAKLHGCNVRLGEEFLRAIVEATLSDDRSMGRVRQACIAVNLTSRKSLTVWHGF